MMDCQILHLFAKPEIAAKGIAALCGHTVFLGPPGSGVRCVAGEILTYAGLAAGKDFVEDPRPYTALINCSSSAMPDAVFCLSPLPSPFGDKLARQLGYQLVELPMGDAMGLRKPCFEDAIIPADSYAATPAVPQRPLHTIGVRGVLIANKDVPNLAVERLLEVLCESDFYPRVNLKKMDPALIQRAGDYPFHGGARVYMHRGDPWPFQKLLTKLQGFIGSVVSVLSAILLAWHWIRRKKVDVGDYQQRITTLDLDAQRAAYAGEFGETELGTALSQLAKIKADVLEQHHVQYMSGDKAVVDVVQRIEELQHLLPSLVRTKVPPKRMQLDFGPPRKAA
jgi:NMT1-like family